MIGGRVFVLLISVLLFLTGLSPMMYNGMSVTAESVVGAVSDESRVVDSRLFTGSVLQRCRHHGFRDCFKGFFEGFDGSLVESSVFEDEEGRWDIIIPDDYPSIQEAIDNVGPTTGYRIYVRAGVYKENLVIDKDGIVLHGENKDNTIIDGYNNCDTIKILQGYTNISGFTIQNSGNNYAGIKLYSSTGNKIYNNKITNNPSYGIIMYRSHANNIFKNTIINNQKGITLDFCLIGNTIHNNTIKNNEIGVFVNSTCRSNIFHHNNFINNNHNAYSLTSEDDTKWDNNHEGNYWDDYTGEDADGDGIGDTPYIIPPYGNVDRYPLMTLATETNPPKIHIIKPENNTLYIRNKKIMHLPTTVIIGKIDVYVNTSDNETGVNRVEFYINKNLKATDAAEPYTWTWDEKTFGRHTIKVVAYDNAGNHAEEETTVWKFF